MFNGNADLIGFNNEYIAIWWSLKDFEDDDDDVSVPDVVIDGSRTRSKSNKDNNTDKWQLPDNFEEVDQRENGCDMMDSGNLRYLWYLKGFNCLSESLNKKIRCLLRADINPIAIGDSSMISQYSSYRIMDYILPLTCRGLHIQSIVCQNCKKIFRDYDDYNDASNHACIADKEFSCPVCMKRYKNKTRSYIDHLASCGININ